MTAALPPTPPGLDRYRSPLSRLLYRTCWLGGRWIQLNTLRVSVTNGGVLGRTPGGYQLACTHLSHLEPFLLGDDRPPADRLDDADRVLRPPGQHVWFLTRFGAIPVRRQGVSRQRDPQRRSTGWRHGRVVGICPEGGVATGERQSVCRGGPDQARRRADRRSVRPAGHPVRDAQQRTALLRAGPVAAVPPRAAVGRVRRADPPT